MILCGICVAFVYQPSIRWIEMLRLHCVCLSLVFLMAGMAKDQRIARQNQIDSQRVNPIDSAEMVFIPPGAFIMGSDAAELDQIWRKFNWPEDWKQNTLTLCAGALGRCSRTRKTERKRHCTEFISC